MLPSIYRKTIRYRLVFLLWYFIEIYLVLLFLSRFIYYRPHLFFVIVKMRTLLIIVLVLAWIAFIGSVLLMSPKGWLGLWIGGMAWGNEYGSKKTLENKLKIVAMVSGIIFLLASLILPYTK